MNVLFLGEADSRVAKFLRGSGEQVVATMEALGPRDASGFEFIVSYRYRHILARDVLELFPGRAVNLHISLLPWNRGMHPNVWSAIEGTPSGVTIHHMDEGLDTGDVIAQKEVPVADDETLRVSYERLSSEVEELFRLHWSEIRACTAPGLPQTGPGSVHRGVELETVEHLLTHGWDTPVGELRRAGRRRARP